MGARSSPADSIVVAALWTLAPVATIGWLHHLGSAPWLRIDPTDLAGWLATRPLEDAVATLARYAALAASYWLTASTLIYLLASVAGAHRLMRASGIFALPAARRAADRLVASMLALSSLGSPLVGLAATGPPSQMGSVTVPADWVPEPYRQPASPASEGGADTEDATGPRTAVLRPPAAGPPPTQPRSPGPGEQEVVVRPGDHMWALAERWLSDQLGRPVHAHEIAPYWVQVVETNRPRIRSGDPDLIFPGEVLVLPDVTPFTRGGS